MCAGKGSDIEENEGEDAEGDAGMLMGGKALAEEEHGEDVGDDHRAGRDDGEEDRGGDGGRDDHDEQVRRTVGDAAAEGREGGILQDGFDLIFLVIDDQWDDEEGGEAEGGAHHLVLIAAVKGDLLLTLDDGAHTVGHGTEGGEDEPLGADFLFTDLWGLFYLGIRVKHHDSSSDKGLGTP